MISAQLPGSHHAVCQTGSLPDGNSAAGSARLKYTLENMEWNEYST